MFLKRKDIEFSARRYGIDALGAMAQGLFASLLVGTILSTLGEQLGITFLVQAGGWAKAATGPAMAVAIGHALHCPPLVLFSLAAVGGAANELGGAGGPLAVLAAAVAAAELGKAVSKETKVDILVTPCVTLPSIYGFNGILLVLSLQLFPLVFLYVSGAMKNIDNSLLEASENMGCKGVRRFFKVILPLCMPTILAATLLVFMRAFADFGTPLLIGQGYRTFPVEIYNAFFSETAGGDYGFACATSVIAILITTVVFLVQKHTSNRFSFTMSALHPIERKKAKGPFNVLIHVFAYGVVGVAFMPQLYILYESFRKTSGKAFVPGYSLESYRSAFQVAGSAIKNTFVIGLSALAVIILLAVLVAYLVVRRRNTANNVIDIMSMLPYIIPGSVVGIALIMAFNQKPLILTGTMIIMVIALVIRRLPYTIRSSVATLQQIPITVEEAAISLGASKVKTFFLVTVPMMANGIISGAILSWVTIITELSTAICLYTVRTQTLTLAIYVYVSRGNDGIAAALATILSLTTVVSLCIFMKVSKSKDVTL